ncbi:MAG: hypothetical protein IPF83_14935 [Rhodanobacteraceae bacterium]|nr:hypothetical protein [Rhodanobacteraceae bacterium]
MLTFVLWTRWNLVQHFFAGDTSFWWQPLDFRHLRSRFDQFAIGVLAAWIFERGVSAEQARRVGWCGLALFAIVFVHVGWFVPRWFEDAIRPWMYFNYTAAAVPLAMIILAMAAGWRPLARCFEGKVALLSGRHELFTVFVAFPDICLGIQIRADRFRLATAGARLHRAGAYRRYNVDRLPPVRATVPESARPQ